MKNVAIIGCGWVGQPLAELLIDNLHSVCVTRRKRKGIHELKNQKLDSFICDLSISAEELDLSQQLIDRNIDIIVGLFPPGFRKGLGRDYSDSWFKLVNEAKKANISKVIMVSSTTVYPSGEGVTTEKSASYDLASNDPAFSDNARIMLEAEQHLKSSGIKYAILRFSGLFGPDRHPGRFVSKLKQVSTLAPANMLHQADAIRAILFALNNISNEVVNVTSPETVSKAEFYQAALDAYSDTLTMPPLIDIPDKRISSEKLCSLGFRFIYPNTLEGLNDC